MARYKIEVECTAEMLDAIKAVMGDNPFTVEKWLETFSQAGWEAEDAVAPQ